ncbi:rho guanine nucleotide exchange factor 40 isoform X2 [Ambystoma mexicanum]|uniref:rho guanine nucleotide exchange factor 40 isoform X2 n=1 Tax=Ambystoma mexicanum TaxID=8296 RepID=UPI0037E8A7AC
MSAEPVEDCVQNTLSALYPPFSATGPTLLCQVFAVVERTYGEDALRYAIEFLVPAKHILQRIQQEACSQYSGFLFCHEGWPLCLHEKVVVQLSSLPWQCLKPGDFYLQVLPYLECSPRLALKCLSQDSRSVQEVLVPEDSYPFIFTVEWLNGINKDRHASRLENCLLSTGERVLRVPWSEVVYPQFVHKDGFIVGRRCPLDPLATGSLLTTGEQLSEILGDRIPGDGRNSSADVKDPHGGPSKTGPDTNGAGGGNHAEICSPFLESIEGEYVELLDFSLSPDSNVDTRQRYLEANSISKTKTVPVRKGHGKGRNKRHRAWLHQKVPKEEALPSRNRGMQTWEGSRGGAEPSSPPYITDNVGTQPTPEERHADGSLVSPQHGYVGAHTRVDLVGTEGVCPEDADQENSSLVIKTPSAFVLDLRAEMVCWEADARRSPKEECEYLSIPSSCQEFIPRSINQLTEGNCVGSLPQGGSFSPNMALERSPTVDKLSLLKDISTEGMFSSHEGNAQELSSKCGKPCQMPENGSNVQCLANQTNDSRDSKLLQVSPISQETTVSDQTPLDWEDEGTIREDDPPDGADKEGPNASHPAECPDPQSGQGSATTSLIGGPMDKGQVTKEQGKPTSHLPTKMPINHMERTASHQPPKKHSKGKRKRKKGGARGTSRPPDTKGVAGTNEVSVEECPGQIKEEEVTPFDQVLEKPSDVTMAGSQSEEALEETGSEVEHVEGSAELTVKEEEGTSDEQLTTECQGAEQDGCLLPPSADVLSQSEDPLLMTAAAAEVESPSALPHQTTPVLGAASTRQEVNWDVLQSGVFSLTGGVALNGSALLIVAPQMPDSGYHSLCDQRDLVNALTHLRSLLRKELRTLGLAVIVDLRSPGASQPPVEVLLRALRELQETSPKSIRSTIVLTEKSEADRIPEEVASLQAIVLTGLEGLTVHVDIDQLPPSLGGTLSYSHSEWMQNHRTLDSLSQLCLEVLQSLLDVIEDLQLEASARTSQEIQALISKQQETMMKVLSDGRLSELQRNGGSLIARLQKSCNHRTDVASAFGLYDEVDNTIHRLVQLSNQRLQSLESDLERRWSQEDVESAIAWISGSGEKMLAGYSELGDSLMVLRQIQETFLAFQALAKEKIRRGQHALGQVNSWELSTVPDPQSCQGTMESFVQGLERKAIEIQKTILLQEFFQRAHKWTLEGVKRLAAIGEGSSSSKQNQDVLASLGQYQQQHPVISEKLFQEMKALALELQSQKALREWTQCWSKCQEMEKIFHKKMEAAIKDKKNFEKTQLSPEAPGGRRNGAPEKHELSPEALKCKKPIVSEKGQLSPKVLKNKKGTSEKVELSPEVPKGKMLTAAQEEPPRPVFLKGNKPTAAGKVQPNQEALKGKKPSAPEKSLSGSEGHRKRSDSISAVSEKGEGRRFWGLGSMLSPSRSMTSLLAPQTPSSTTGSPDTPSFHSGAPSVALTEDSDCDQVFVESERNLQRLMSEVIGCEQEYVASLGLLAEMLSLELERRDLTPDQRQEWSALCGIVEKLHAFHSGYFLQELEGCLSHPLRVATCFIRYADQISLYSLYVKNRPKAESILTSHRSTIKVGQDDAEASLLQHLQKPLEQLEQYWRFLDEMVQECSQELVQERQSLCTAQELLLSQVHHGKNLLAVDAIRGFEVDLKEHGQLLLRDEFTIFCGRKKSQRHVFLFEHLLLFSKLKISEGGLETYSYKQAFKTADMGLTENIGDSGLRFELWFRRRKTREAFTFQAGSTEAKNRWTTVTAQLLWHQATDNKERQSPELASVGLGNKPFLDIKASFGALSERTINALLMARGARTRASVAVSSFDHSGPCRQSSCPSASSCSPTAGLGSLNLPFPFRHNSTGPSSPGASSLPGSIAEEGWEYSDCKTSPGADTLSSVACSESQRDSKSTILGVGKNQNRSLFIPRFGQGHQPTNKEQTAQNPSTSL